MKKTVTFLLILMNVCAFSQQKGTFKAGFNRCLYGSGDYRGFEYYNEYLFPLKPRITLAPSFHIGYGSNSVKDFDEPRLKTTSFGVDVMLYVSPWKFQKNKIQIGFGPSVRHFSDGSPNIMAYNVIQLPNSNFVYDGYRFAYSTKPDYWRLGYSAVIDGELNITPKWVVGGRLSFSNYAYDVISQFGLSVGHRF